MVSMAEPLCFSALRGENQVVVDPKNVRGSRRRILGPLKGDLESLTLNQSRAFLTPATPRLQAANYPGYASCRACLSLRKILDAPIAIAKFRPVLDVNVPAASRSVRFLRVDERCQ
jgi:hypothetical protein